MPIKFNSRKEVTGFEGKFIEMKSDQGRRKRVPPSREKGDNSPYENVTGSSPRGINRDITNFRVDSRANNSSGKDDFDGQIWKERGLKELGRRMA